MSKVPFHQCKAEGCTSIATFRKVARSFGQQGHLRIYSDFCQLHIVAPNVSKDVKS